MNKIILSLTMLGLLSFYALAAEPYLRHLQRAGAYREDSSYDKEWTTRYKERIRQISPSAEIPTQRLKDMKLFAALVEPTDFRLQYYVLQSALRDDYFMRNTHKFTAPPRMPKDVFSAIIKMAKLELNGERIDYLCREADAYQELIKRGIEPQDGSYAAQLIPLLDLP